MKRMANHLIHINTLNSSNAWILIDETGRRFLVDSGHMMEKGMLLFNLWSAGIRTKGALDGLLLTHRHSDHAGNASWVRGRFGCPVAIHRADADILSGKKPPPVMPSLSPKWDWKELLCRTEDRFPAVCEVDLPLEHGDAPWGFQVFHIGGHTDGLSMYYHATTKTLFSGDAILTGMPPLFLGKKEQLMLAMPEFSQNSEHCHKNVLAFIRDQLPDIDFLCSGHGPVVSRDVRRKLLALDTTTTHESHS